FDRELAGAGAPVLQRQQGDAGDAARLVLVAHPVRKVHERRGGQRGREDGVGRIGLGLVGQRDGEVGGEAARERRQAGLRQQDGAEAELHPVGAERDPAGVHGTADVVGLGASRGCDDEQSEKDGQSSPHGRTSYHAGLAARQANSGTGCSQARVSADGTSTAWRVPASRTSTAAGPTRSPAPPPREGSSPEVCDGQGRATQPSAPGDKRTRTNSVSCEAFLRGASSTASTAGRCSLRCPPRRRSAGRTYTAKHTSAETGLPGSPKNRWSPRVPNVSGLPGFCATFQKRRSTPSASSASFTKSNSPTETPPVDSTTSACAAPASRSRMSSKRSRTMGSTVAAAPASATAAASA